MKKIGESELILNKDGSIFHLHLLPENIADTIILVGDQGRVETVSDFFEKIELKKQNREFVTHTGYFNNKRISVISTGIGTDNIDIVLNELDALVNIDLKTRQVKEKRRMLNFIRIGTSGALQSDIPVDTPIVSKLSIGFDGLINFYANRDSICLQNIQDKFIEHTLWNKLLTTPYIVEASNVLLKKVAGEFQTGITISAPGFYGPQGRELRLPLASPDLNSRLTSFNYNGLKITNYEMESSAIYGLSRLLGHQALTVCNIIANRIRKEYSKDYKKEIKKTIKIVLERLTN